MCLSNIFSYQNGTTFGSESSHISCNSEYDNKIIHTHFGIKKVTEVSALSNIEVIDKNISIFQCLNEFSYHYSYKCQLSVEINTSDLVITN